MPLTTTMGGDKLPDGGVFRAYDISEDERLTGAVVRAVAATTGRDPESLPPLADSVDPDAIDALFHSRSGNTVESLTFRFSDAEVTLTPEYVYVRCSD